jgi:hypothetical protein
MKGISCGCALHDGAFLGLYGAALSLHEETSSIERNWQNKIRV